MPRNAYGLDLGTYEIKVYDKRKNKIWKQRCVIAFKSDVKNSLSSKSKIFSVGDEAFEMYGRTPSNINVVFPMKAGAVAGFEDMQFLLSHFLNDDKLFKKSSAYLVAVPTDFTEVERKAFYDLVLNSQSKAKSIRIVERGIADALGAGTKATDTKGVLIINFGSETTELSALVSGGMVVNRLLKSGSDEFNNAIISFMRRKHDLVISHSVAEKLKRKFGVIQQEEGSTTIIVGKSILTGLPRREKVLAGSIRAALKEPLDEIVGAIRTMVNRISPDIKQEMQKNGIYLTGGAAKLNGLSDYLEACVNLPVHIPSEPELSTVRGLEIILSDESIHERFTYSMLSEDYRRMR